MLVPELKELLSPDLPDLSSDQPEDPKNFSVLVQALIGSAEDDAADTFDFLVCSPAWLSSELQNEPYLWGRHFLVIPEYSYEAIEKAITQLCADITGEDWDDVAEQLARFARWEYEDYDDDDEEDDDGD